jgi:hypothetical protein
MALLSLSCSLDGASEVSAHQLPFEMSGFEKSQQADDLQHKKLFFLRIRVKLSRAGHTGTRCLCSMPHGKPRKGGVGHGVARTNFCETLGTLTSRAPNSFNTGGYHAAYRNTNSFNMLGSAQKRLT